MPVIDLCVVGKMTHKMDKSVSMYCMPVENGRRAHWIRSLCLVEKGCIKAAFIACAAGTFLWMNKAIPLICTQLDLTRM